MLFMKEVSLYSNSNITTANHAPIEVKRNYGFVCKATNGEPERTNSQTKVSLNQRKILLPSLVSEGEAQHSRRSSQRHVEAQDMSRKVHVKGYVKFQPAHYGPARR